MLKGPLKRSGEAEDGKHRVQAPKERRSPGKCWRLKKWLCGMRQAARAWVEDCAEKLETLGMQRGKETQTCYFDEVSQTR